MTDSENTPDILVGIRLADAIGRGDAASIREISTSYDHDIIQSNGTQIFVTTFISLSGPEGDFANDVWKVLPQFLIDDIPDRSVLIGADEHVLQSLIGGFLQKNVIATINGNQAEIFNPSNLPSGYFVTAAAVGEALFGLIKVVALKRFNNNYELAKSFVSDTLSLHFDVEQSELNLS